jgi:integrase
MQKGSLFQSTRANGTTVWEYRWRDRSNGAAIYRRIVIGTIEQYPTAADARSVVQCLILECNPKDPRLSGEGFTLSQLVEHYRQKELVPDNPWKSYATKQGYAIYLKRWILPKWGTHRLGRIKPVDVETWLRQLPLARASCAKIRNLMSVLFNHARRYQFFDSNPIQLVRQSGKRRTAPCILQDHEIRGLLEAVDPLTRILIFTVATTGLRQSELFGLRWSDIDFEAGQINVTRSVVHGHVSNCKTESSAKPVPMGRQLSEILKHWRTTCQFPGPHDWVFASARAQGKHPLWGQTIMRKHVHPVAKELGIQKKIGWHTFRHSYSTILRSMGTDIKVQQDLLRHSSARMTLDTYTQSITAAKVLAQQAVMDLLLAPRNCVLVGPTQID